MSSLKDIIHKYTNVQKRTLEKYKFYANCVFSKISQYKFIQFIFNELQEPWIIIIEDEIFLADNSSVDNTDKFISEKYIINIHYIKKTAIFTVSDKKNIDSEPLYTFEIGLYEF